MEADKLAALLRAPARASVSTATGRPLGAGGSREPPSAVRMAIGMLIQHPRLADGRGEALDIAEVDIPGLSLLQEVVAVLRAHPGLNTAALLEHFRGHEQEHALMRLATWQHPALEPEGVEAEFEGVIGQVGRAVTKERTQQLIQKEKVTGLSEDEKRELSRLLAEKLHPATPVPPQR